MNLLPNSQEYQREILSGLMRTHKSISPKFLYDEQGSEIFEEICQLEEYYPVQAENEILSKYASEIAKRIGKNAILIEPGCGNCVKVQTLLKELDHPAAYLALDISKDFLEKVSDNLQAKFPKVPVYSLVADYTRPFSMPQMIKNTAEKRVVFFPGSTIGNLDPEEAQALLKRMGSWVSPGGGLLIGVDLKKARETLELAYDDPKGVTAEFNFNLLDRLNREFAANFDRNKFKYVARYNEQQGRVEMFLVSKSDHSVQLADETISFEEDESIHTENSYKYSPPEFIELATRSGFDFQQMWMDEKKRFGLYYFEQPKRGKIPPSRLNS